MTGVHSLNIRARDRFSALRLEVIRPGLWRHLDRFEYRPPEPLPGPVVAEAGDETDLDSVPRWPFAFLLTKGRTVSGAAAHDALYRNGRLWRGGPKVTRRMADRIFLAAMRDEGVGERPDDPPRTWLGRKLAALRARLLRRAIHMGVRIGGRRGWNNYRRAEAVE